MNRQIGGTKTHALKLPPMVMEQILELSASKRVDLNTVASLQNGSYIIGEPRTGLMILANTNMAKQLTTAEYNAMFQPAPRPMGSSGSFEP